MIRYDPTTHISSLWIMLFKQLRSMALYIGLLPTWGDKVVKRSGIGPIVFNQDKAYTYGRYLGQRYKDVTNVLWILGGDRPADVVEDIWRASAPFDALASLLYASARPKPFYQ